MDDAAELSIDCFVSDDVDVVVVNIVGEGVGGIVSTSSKGARQSYLI